MSKICYKVQITKINPIWLKQRSLMYLDLVLWINLSLTEHYVGYSPCELFVFVYFYSL